MKNADDIRKAIELAEELRKLLDRAPVDTVPWYVEDNLGGIENFLAVRLRRVEAGGRVVAGRIEGSPTK